MLVIDSSVPYALYRVHQDGTEELIPGSETHDQIETIKHGQRLTHQEPSSAFTMRQGGRSVYKFNHKALALRVKPGGVAAMLSVLS